MIFILLFTLIQTLTPKAHGLVFIEENKKVADAIAVYHAFLEGQSLDEIKKDHSVHESVTNSHQALDYIIYLTERSLPEKIFGKKFDSCRIDLKEDEGLDQFTHSFGVISSSIRGEYLNEWVYKIPERMSCHICLRDENCKSQSDKWKKSELKENSTYRNFQKSKQIETCKEMSSYALNQATSGVVLESGIKPNCPPGSICPSKHPYWSIAYTYDFNQCQEDFLVCPEIKDTNQFIHPSCLGENIEKNQEKIEWLNQISNSVLASCHDLPIKKVKEEPKLITCLEKADNNFPEGVINLNKEGIDSLETTVPFMEFTDREGNKSTYQASKFQIKLSELTERLKTEKTLYDTQLAKFKEIGERFYHSESKTYQYNKKNNKISDLEFERRKSELLKAQEALSVTTEEKKELLLLEKSSFENNQRGSYLSSIDSAINQPEKEIELDYYYDSPRIIEKKILTEKTNYEFPASENDQKVLLQFLTQKIKNIFDNLEEPSESLHQLSKAWAVKCIEKKFDKLGCNSPRLSTPYCQSCPSELTQAQLDVERDEKIPMTKKAHRSRFYQQMRCLEYQTDFNKIHGSQEVQKLKKQICSKEFKIKNKSLRKSLPLNCSE